MSSNYGRIGNNSGRRSGGAVFQWIVIGSILGFGCAAVIFLGGLVFGLIGIDPTASGRIGSTPTAIVQVITATIDPNLPTITPMIITATPDEEPTQESEIILPTQTPPIEDTEAPASTEETAPPTADTSGQTVAPTEERSIAAGGVPPELESIASQLVFIQGGTFRMGTTQEEVIEAVRLCENQGGQCASSDADDAIPQHEVTISSFQIEANEVTYTQYVAFLNYLQSTGRNHQNGCGTGGLAQPCALTKVEDLNVSYISYDTNVYETQPSFFENYPVSNISWFGAEAYCRTIGRRLPTEAEWEFAARGQDTTFDRVYPWGRLFDASFANTSQLSEDVGGPLPIINFPQDSSPFGVLNMGGNVSEWVADWYSDSIYSTYATQGIVTDPTGAERGTQRVVRGGNFAYNPFFARTTQRTASQPSDQRVFIGFRCAADLDQPASSLDNTALTPVGTPDPASLGTIDDNNNNSGAPGLPTAIGTATDVPALPPGD